MNILLLFLFAVIVGLAILWWQQEKILFQPPGHVDVGDVAADRIDYIAADGQHLFGFLAGNCADADVLLCFHGNADLALWQIEWASEVVRRFGIAVFLAEYRGYGGITGRPTYDASRLDADAAYRCVTETLDVSRSRVYVFGHSLGSAVAMELALRFPVRGALLQAPFTSAREMASRTIAWPVAAMWDIVSRVHFDTVAAVQQLDAPVSVIHGTRDLVIPHRMGEAVYRAAKSKGAFALIEKAGHNNVVDVAGENYWNWFSSALLSTAERAGR